MVRKGIYSTLLARLWYRVLTCHLIGAGHIARSNNLHSYFVFQSLIAGGNFSLAMLLVVITNCAAVFTVPPMLVWLTDLTSKVNVARFGLIMLLFFLVIVLPTIVSNTVGSCKFLIPFSSMHRAFTLLYQPRRVWRGSWRAPSMFFEPSGIPCSC